MPALRSAAGVARGTRVPEGASPARWHGQGIYRDVPLWPGIAWGHDARCLCSWAVRYGVMQVKVQSGACTVHLGSEQPLPVLFSLVIAAITEAIEEGDGRGVARCGTTSGYNRHRREKTETCPACRAAKRARNGVPNREAA